MRNQLENFTAGEFLGSPALIYFDEVDGKGYLASATDTAHPAQAIVLVDCDADETGQAYFDGVVDYAFGEVSQATPLYLSDTAGEITSTAPANVQRVGFVIDSGRAFFSFAGFSGGGAYVPLSIPDGTYAQMAATFGRFGFKYYDGQTAIGIDEDGLQGSAIFSPDGASVFSISNGAVELVVGSTALGVGSGSVVVNSTTAGFRPPSMTSAQKEAISSPTDGSEVWDTDLDGKCVYDGVKWLRLSQKSAPTIAVGAGAGSGATVTVSGNDIEGLITLTGGTSATTSATVLTLTFFDSYTTAPIAVIISESNQNALLMPVGRKPGFDAVSTTTFTMVNASVNGIVNGTVYKYTYRVIQ